MYEEYHDHEWGVPIHDERELFERLVLEAFQCGLSWSLVLKRREGMRAALDGFDEHAIAAYGPDDVERLLRDDRMLKNRRKIEAIVRNARAVAALHEAGGTLEQVLWAAKPATHERPASDGQMAVSSPQAEALARELKGLGFSFVGPVTMYATMQAIGVVNDHIVGCPAGDALSVA